jgi:hypothetical protein
LPTQQQYTEPSAATPVSDDTPITIITVLISLFRSELKNVSTKPEKSNR